MSNIFDLFKKIEKKEDTSPVSFIISGLGNPGREYESTRHNVGFLAVDYIAESVGVKIDRAKFHALVGEGKIGDKRVLFMKPTTLMNNSGVAIGEAAAFYKIPAENVIVLHDEISFEPGVIRIRRKGSAGGHNGLKSIIAHLPGEDFPRIKIGVGKKPNPQYDLADWVLSHFTAQEEKALQPALERAADAALAIMDHGIYESANRFNGTGK